MLSIQYNTNFSSVEERIEAQARATRLGHVMDEYMYDECRCLNCQMVVQLIPGKPSRMRGQALVDRCTEKNR